MKIINLKLKSQYELQVLVKLISTNFEKFPEISMKKTRHIHFYM